MSENIDSISSPRHVVLDGSNIIWGGAGEKNTPDINRLFSAIAFYEGLGYTVIPVMSRKQWNAIRFHQKEVYERINSELRQHGKLQLADEDDILIIHLAIENNAWLITQDTFQDKTDKKTNEVKKRERSLNPDLDWSDIDSRTRGTRKSKSGRFTSGHHWNVEGSDFFDPTMPRAPPSYLFSEYEEIQKMSREVRHLLDKIHTEIDELELDDDEIPNLMDRYVGQALNKILALESIIPDFKIPSREQLEGLTVPQLKELCRAQGLTTSGNKMQLIEHLFSKGNEKSEEQTSLLKSSAKTKNGSFTKKEFIEELFSGKSTDELMEFGATYSDLIEREPKFNLKEQGIKPSVYIQGCSNLVEIEIRKNADCTYYFIKSKQISQSSAMEIATSVFDSILSNGDKVDVGELYRKLGKAIIQDDIENTAGWSLEMRKIFKFSKRGSLQDFLSKISPKKLCFEENNSIVYYCDTS